MNQNLTRYSAGIVSAGSENFEIFSHACLTEWAALRTLLNVLQEAINDRFRPYDIEQ